MPIFKSAIETSAGAAQFDKDFDDLIWMRRAGHMGHWEYVEDALHLWEDFLQANSDDYYIPASESALIEQCSKMSASLFGNQPVTAICRGPGSRFSSKEAIILRSILNLKGIVYIDTSDEVLEQALAEGKKLFPDCWHETINHDFYDPKLKYRVEGQELNLCFGATLMNIDGFPDSIGMLTQYEKNMQAIAVQMQRGGHFITTYDHNEDTQAVENAYRAQSNLAKYMIRHYVRPDDVEFVVKLHEETNTLSHGFKFREDTIINTPSGQYVAGADDIRWFNNSVKMPRDMVMQYNQQSGFEYAIQTPYFEPTKRLAWHHMQRSPEV